MGVVVVGVIFVPTRHFKKWQLCTVNRLILYVHSVDYCLNFLGLPHAISCQHAIYATLHSPPYVITYIIQDDQCNFMAVILEGVNFVFREQKLSY